MIVHMLSHNLIFDPEKVDFSFDKIDPLLQLVKTHLSLLKYERNKLLTDHQTTVNKDGRLLP